MAGKRPDMSNFKINGPYMNGANRPSVPSEQNAPKPVVTPNPTKAPTPSPTSSQFQFNRNPVSPNVEQKPKTFPTYDQINNNFKPMNTVGPTPNIVQGSQVQGPKDSDKEPRRHSKLITIIACVVILLAVATLVVVNFLPSSKITADVAINIKCNYNFVDPTVEAGGESREMLPGDAFDSRIKISLFYNEGERPEHESKYYLRFRLYSLCQDNYYPNLFENDMKQSDWYAGLDGYFYYNGNIDSSTPALTILESHTLSKDIGNEFNGQTITLEFSVEILQSTADGSVASILTMWPTAPYAWRAERQANLE